MREHRKPFSFCFSVVLSLVSGVSCHTFTHHYSARDLRGTHGTLLTNSSLNFFKLLSLSPQLSKAYPVLYHRTCSSEGTGVIMDLASFIFPFSGISYCLMSDNSYRPIHFYTNAPRLIFLGCQPNLIIRFLRDLLKKVHHPQDNV